MDTLEASKKKPANAGKTYKYTLSIDVSGKIVVYTDIDKILVYDSNLDDE